MTTSTLDEQVAELMRLVSEACSAHIDLVLAQNQGMEWQAEQAAAAASCSAVEAFARAALERSTVPDGWRLVPIALTPEMVAAWASACAGPPEPGKSYSAEETRNIVATADWNAMLNAAPPATKVPT